MDCVVQVTIAQIVTLEVKRFLFCSQAVGIPFQAQVRATHFRCLVLADVLVGQSQGIRTKLAKRKRRSKSSMY